jgi:hypothetical protein
MAAFVDGHYRYVRRRTKRAKNTPGGPSVRQEWVKGHVRHQ